MGYLGSCQGDTLNSNNIPSSWCVLGGVQPSQRCTLAWTLTKTQACTSDTTPHPLKNCIPKPKKVVTKKSNSYFKKKMKNTHHVPEASDEEQWVTWRSLPPRGGRSSFPHLKRMRETKKEEKKAVNKMKSFCFVAKKTKRIRGRKGKECNMYNI